MTHPLPPRRLRTIFAVPLLIAIASLAGLVVALTGDGWRDFFSWAALLVPPAAFGWAFVCRS